MGVGEVIEFLKKEDRWCNAKEISVATNVSIWTAHRILRTLDKRSEVMAKGMVTKSVGVNRVVWIYKYAQKKVIEKI